MRFLVLHHTAWPGHPDHYDLMLQLDEGGKDDERALKTFATTSDQFPLPTPHQPGHTGETVTLQHIQDHRRAYLRYEGAVSGGRGTVTRVEEGRLELLRPLSDSLDEIVVALFGTRLRGSFVLREVSDGLYSMEVYQQ
jgi:hypothetical protein